MIEQLFLNIQHYIDFLPLHGYELIFLIIVGEAIAFVGVLIPGTLLLVLLGFFVQLGYFNLFVVLAVVIIGALIGDIFSYYLGRRYGTDVKLGRHSVFKYLYLPEAGDLLLQKGGLSVISGRFIGPTRVFVPFYLGAAGEREKKFIIYDIIGVVIWAVFYLLLGMIFGDSYDKIKQFMDDLDFFVVLFLVLTIAPFLAAKFYKKKMAPKI